MRFDAPILLLATHAACLFGAGAADQATTKQCGDLGVLQIDQTNLPEGVNLSEVRKCTNHPLKSHSRVKGRGSLAPMGAAGVLEGTGYDNATSLIQPRDCRYDAPFGCADGYCWKSCGNPGEWCWTARNQGLGAWYTCNPYQDCGSDTYDCGRNCDKCGCSC
ncbi:hypothetical protein F4677DRAFT_464780 [Hypoxylon crocopeplum]|nr:hypothetical protein F4677DRAFT_464780 [Hypoxylon crocopeplum]